MPLQTGLFADLIAEETRVTAAVRAALLEQRTSLENPQSPLSMPAEWMLDMFNGGRTDSGIRVSALTALNVVTLLSGVDLIGGKIGSLPCHIYERVISPLNGRAVHKISYDHDNYEMVHAAPNSEMTRQTFIKAYVAHAIVWGNGYAEIERNAGAEAVGYWPRNPAKTRPRRITKDITLDPTPWRPFPVQLKAGQLVYETTDWLEADPDEVDNLQLKRLIAPEDMLHVPGLALDGRIGQDTVWLARGVLGLALATEKFGAKYYANFAKPGGLLELPGLSKPDRDQAKQSWVEAQGGENSHRIAAMPQGTKFTPISNNPQDSQTLETREFIRTEIASLLHLPARMVGDTSRSGKNTTEQENQEILDYALMPWMTAIKLEWKRKLFPHPNVGRRPKSPYYVDFDTWEMTRADAASREKYYQTGSQNRYLCPNDIREKEKLNPIEQPWAEEFMMPINYTMADTPINPNTQDGAGNGEPSARGLHMHFNEDHRRVEAPKESNDQD